ncbi:Ricin and poly(3-hydroxybutyrate) depolymerase fusion [Sorangium cellulosum]|nr:Ricin and poly(3-hydroxybutyrate) depolymerase fusion [Sorangium cellulosum]
MLVGDGRSSATVGSSAGVGGSGGRPGSGEAGAGGSGSGGSGGETQSAGCGSATAPASGRFSIDVGGTTREYILAVPDGYDANRAYRLIFAWHPRGGSAEQVATGFGGGYYGLQSRAAGSAIFVSPEGIDQGWANSGGRDIAFLRAMLDRLRGELCIDESRIFSTGFSYGGMMSYAIGCAMGDVFRAIAPMSGALYSGCDDGDHPVAMWGAHGDADNVVPLDNGRTARDVFLERNGCGSQTTPVDPSPCVSYEGCDAGYPVVWCEFSGGHAMPSNSGESIWRFFSQF